MQGTWIRQSSGRQEAIDGFGNCQLSSRRHSSYWLHCQVCFRNYWRDQHSLCLPSKSRWCRLRTKTRVQGRILLRSCPEILEGRNQARNRDLPEGRRSTHLRILPTTSRGLPSWTNTRDLEIPMHLWCSEARCHCRRRSRRQLHDGLRGLVSRPKALTSTFRASFDIL